MVSETEIEVRYAETDQMGVVYHANYLIWFEIGRTKLVEDLGLRYVDMEDDGYFCPVLDVHAQYKRPLKYGENALVKTRVIEYNGVKVVYGYEIVDEHGALCVAGTSSHVVVSKETFQPVAMRKVLPNWHTAYERVVRSTMHE
ncbi:acyl-CoA thioesterase [Alicyclobacillus fastidiosus]|uniref:Thioesterase family protein n=1 Tax=Alicyclobacillus fastidiosus TaxID=392011 RepID=A0ABV5AHN1_9BACL|nr:thioesterase family protein [Alicyclobacillus fastidiosus]WEH08994.1 thioesterase family protein [Alicyclobacillus fastidiosus]